MKITGFCPMAIYHFTTKAMSRSVGMNAIESAAYRRAAQLWNSQTGEAWDFTRKKGVVHSEITVPACNMAWVNEFISQHETNPDEAASSLWSRVESSERRVDARLARDVEFSLPVELSMAQSIVLAREFITDQLVSRGMIADWNVHWDNGNPHVHVMLTTRELLPTGFGQKVREWNHRNLLLDWRKQWADTANYHLALNGYDIRIDHRSYEDQGIELIPSLHHGQSTKKRHQQGKVTERMETTKSIARENLARISARPALVQEKVMKEKSHFTENDIEHEVLRHFHQAMGAPRTSPEVIGSVLRTLHAVKTDTLHSALEQEQLLSAAQEHEVFSTLEKQDSVFSEKDIARVLHEKLDGVEIADAELFLRAMVQLKTSSALIALGAGEDGRERFTTPAMIEMEESILHAVNHLSERSHQRISENEFQTSLEAWQKEARKTLTAEQRAAVFHLTRPTSLSCLVGLAGTGKSFSLGAARHVWQRQGLNVIGVALAGKAADGLTQEAGILSSTLESFRLQLEKGVLTLSSSDVIVMDEAGMTDSFTFQWLLKAVRDAGAKLICVGDPNQLQPIGPGAIFRALLERLGFAALETVYRQKTEWQREATLELARGETANALARYQEAGLIRFQETETSSIRALVEEWQQLHQQGVSTDSMIVLSHRNRDIEHLNQAIRTTRIQTGALMKGYRCLRKQQHDLGLAVHDRLLFHQNDRSLRVKNGMLGTVTQLEVNERGEVSLIEVLLDGHTTPLRFSPSHYSHFDYGYATTVHKSQGMTVDHSLVYAGGTGWNRFLTYVALSRHRYSTQIFADQGTFRDDLHFIKSLSRHSLKDSLLDFPEIFARLRGIRPTQGLMNVLTERLKAAYDALKHRCQTLFALHPHEKAHVRGLHTPHENPEEAFILASPKTQQRQNAKRVADYVDAKTEVGIANQGIQCLLKDWGLSSFPSFDSPFSSAFERHPTAVQFQEARAKRDRLAAELYQIPERYASALPLYSLTPDDLALHARRHAFKKILCEYQVAKATQKQVLQDRAAFHLQHFIKESYPLLREARIDLETLRISAKRHEYRHLHTTLNARQRTFVRQIERYQTLTQHLGKAWYREKTALQQGFTYVRTVASAMAHHEQQWTQERNRLAANILETLSREKSFSALLATFDIEVPENLALSPSSHESRAEKRWHLLHRHAALHRTRETVQAWQRTSQKGDIVTSARLAKQIQADLKGHHPALLALEGPIRQQWHALSKTLKEADEARFIASLNETQKALYPVIQEYRLARREVAHCWQEITETLTYTPIETAQPEILLHPEARNAMIQRDSLAQHLRFATVEALTPFFQHYRWNLEKFQKEATLAGQRELVGYYVTAKAHRTPHRYRLAASLAKDVKRFGRALQEANVDFSTLFRDSRIHALQTLTEAATPEEARILRLERRYQQLSRQTATAFEKAKTTALPQDKARAIEILSHRNQVAAKLWSQKDRFETLQHHFLIEGDEWEEPPIERTRLYQRLEKTFASEKLPLQAEAHQVKQQHVKAWHYHQETFESNIHPALLAFNNKTLAPSQTSAFLRELSFTLEDVLASQKPITHQPQAFKAALQEQGLLTHWQQSQVLIEKLQQQFQLHEAWQAAQDEKTQTPIIDSELQKRLQRARNIVKASKPIENTLAAQYLQTHRKLEGPFSKDLRFHPQLYHGETQQHYPALLAITRNTQGDIRAVQATFLDPETVSKAKLTCSKLTYGNLSLEASGVLLQQGTSPETIAVSEGVETGLSVANANPRLTVYAVLGSSNFGRAPVASDTKEILFLADNDGERSASSQKLDKVAEQLALKGLRVSKVEPHEIKSDFNDVLVNQGIEAVKTLLQTPTLLRESKNIEHIQHRVIDVLQQAIGVPSEKENAALSMPRTAEYPQSSETRAKTSAEQPCPLNERLKTYVELEVKVSALYQQKLLARTQDKSQLPELSEHITHLSRTIKLEAFKLSHQPEIQAAFDTMANHHVRAEHVSKRGGFEAILTRMEQGEFLKADIETVLTQVRSTSVAAKRNVHQSQQRSSGRKR